MTDLPVDDRLTQARQRVFNTLLALKASNQAQGRQRMQHWNDWYASLNSNERMRADEHLKACCDEVSKQFGKPRRMPKL
ncbi:hypothetical protein [Pseudomonas viridiflava]|uniref:hypothetical protein n=1 Tax=Pseudomonas viridiflava TaxID=33069 RepID=UPI000F028ACC|nr:hypothetical protein [Pseudomonas viridiflava]